MMADSCTSLMVVRCEPLSGAHAHYRTGEVSMSEHVREHRSLLAAAEKRLLIRIAGHLPPSIHSDHLTVLALAAMALAGIGFWLARWDTNWLFVVVVALGVNWFGDSLDGTLARIRHVERPRYGFYVDHVVDIVGISFLLTGLACSGFMTPVIASSLLVAYLLVSGEVFLATAVRGVFRIDRKSTRLNSSH